LNSKCAEIYINISIYINIMERGGKVNYHRELNDTEKDHKIIDSVLERFESYDSFEVDAAKAKKICRRKKT